MTYQASAQAKYGEMYLYEATKTVTIAETNQYHAVDGFTTGVLDGWTFDAGSAGAGNITTSGGTAINIADADHGLVSGDYVTVSSANHAGSSVVTLVDSGNFTLAIAYVGDEACDWQQGAYLRASAGAGGNYHASMSISGYSAATGKTLKWEMNKNATAIDKMAVERTHGNTDLGSMASSGIVTISAGDRLWVSVKNKTSGHNFVLEHANVNCTRI